ncbi:MAG: 3-oxoacyl-[acyl-carrier protein] reductase [uncultured Gemmatimonadetes bacterium]|uniref:3-oxoacyl-[acyl-carrier protein] reductase n=1 Tax=uncultured Gemmatimonadota bacterium TaxID=203437 RepID=A0A6J4KIQ4_9BACT|nr:MAG: 3-oxoacyl-[acyl-carrier protein] reductase [uncultured Gemmatimonadota bacterium]
MSHIAAFDPSTPTPGAGRFAGKNAVVTGGTTGLGFAAAQRLLAEGARVLITGRNAARVEAAGASLGAGASAARADVCDLADLDALAERARSEFGAPPAGGIDVVFANAGVGTFAPLSQASAEHFDELFATNVRGVYFTVQRLLPLLRPGASIILNASAVNAKGMAGGSVYFATKSAVRSLARTLAAELAPQGIRVNAVSPGLVPTPFVGKMGLPQEALDAFAGQVMSTAPLGRVGTPEEIAAAVVFLAGDESRYITAHDLLVDGGWASI